MLSEIFLCRPIHDTEFANYLLVLRGNTLTATNTTLDSYNAQQTMLSFCLPKCTVAGALTQHDLTLAVSGPNQDDDSSDNYYESGIVILFDTLASARQWQFRLTTTSTNNSSNVFSSKQVSPRRSSSSSRTIQPVIAHTYDDGMHSTENTYILQGRLSRIEEESVATSTLHNAHISLLQEASNMSTEEIHRLKNALVTNQREVKAIKYHFDAMQKEVVEALVTLKALPIHCHRMLLMLSKEKQSHHQAEIQTLNGKINSLNDHVAVLEDCLKTSSMELRRTQRQRDDGLMDHVFALETNRRQIVALQEMFTFSEIMFTHNSVPWTVHATTLSFLRNTCSELREMNSTLTERNNTNVSTMEALQKDNDRLASQLNKVEYEKRVTEEMSAA
eukprot:PhF_6_TR25485/c0_g1_i2/m.35426